MFHGKYYGINQKIGHPDDYITVQAAMHFGLPQIAPTAYGGLYGLYVHFPRSLSAAALRCFALRSPLPGLHVQPCGCPVTAANALGPGLFLVSQAAEANRDHFH